MGCRNNSHIHEEYTWVSMQKSHVLKVYVTIIYSNSCMYVGFLKESYVHIRNSFLGYFWEFSEFGVFWKVLANKNIFPTVQRWVQMELQNSRYRSSKLGVFSVTFNDFHEVPSWKCRHAMKSWESGHRKRCVILSYKSDVPPIAWKLQCPKLVL